MGILTLRKSLTLLCVLSYTDRTLDGIPSCSSWAFSSRRGASATAGAD